jgi:valyl-tRNA synthetase
VETLAKLNRAFDELRYDEMADAIYHFVWGTFCDWYVELVKGAFDEETKVVAAWAFDQILVMLHPLMPFITEELWSAMGERPYELIVAKWPDPQAQIDTNAKDKIETAITAIAGARALRAELNIPWTAELVPHLVRENNLHAIGQLIGNMVLFQPQLRQMAKLAPAVEVDTAPLSSAQMVIGGVTVALPLGDVIDLDAERARLAKAAAAAEKERDSLAQRLANPNFTERAKPEAVEKARADHEAKAAEAERLRAALERLG